VTRVRILARADRDIEEAAEEYACAGGGELGMDFYRAVERAWHQLGEHPEIGMEVVWESPRLRGVRRWQVARPFDAYQVFYRVTDEGGVEVIRVLHGARDNLRILAKEDQKE
jgi:plasmid stabilization system protein ParE